MRRGTKRAEKNAVEALRDTWSTYPSEWKADSDLSMGAATLGEEWGGAAFADGIVALVEQYLGPQADVLELGCGGGKFSSRIAPACRTLLCTDISQEMVDHTRETLAQRGLGENVSFRVLDGTSFSGVPDASIDFIFSYDVQLHLQPQNVYAYMVDARRVLRADGVFMLHGVDLASEGGRAHFIMQYGFDTWKYGFEDPRRRGHIYYMSRSQMQALGDLAGLALDRLVDDYPPPDSPLRAITSGRDLIGFYRMRPSRLRALDPATARLVRAEGEHTVYAVIDGQRAAFASAQQFEFAGLAWERVETLSAEELAAIPETHGFAAWE